MSIRRGPLTNSTYFGEMPEHGFVVLKAREERPFYTVDGDGAHMSSPFVEPRIDQSSSCGIALAEQRRHRGIGEWFCVGLGKV